MKCILLVLILLFVGCFQSESVIVSRPNQSLEFRLISREPRANWEKINFHSTGDPVFMAPSVIINGSDVLLIAILNNDIGERTVSFTVNTKAAKRLKAFTSNNLGSEMAIAIDGEARFALEISSPFSRNVHITGDAAEIESIYADITEPNDR